MLRPALVLAFALALAACEGVQLNRSNDDFVDLSRESAAARLAYENGELDPDAFAALTESFQLRFAANGDEAAKSAEAADDPASAVSFYSAAVRNYLKAGALRDTRIPGLADDGIALCARPEMKGLNGLPTTCGYLNFAKGQAISNQWERVRAPIVGRAAAARQSQAFLPARDGRSLAEAVQGYAIALDALADGYGAVDWPVVDPGLEPWYRRQQERVYCNAADAILLLDDVVEADGAWSRADAQTRAQDTLDAKVAELGERPGGFPEAPDCGEG